MIRIGHGFDIHRFQENRPLILGGVNIPYEKGMEAHSDGDVLIHAVCDALLGAAALGDIGKHFPDHGPQYKNKSSNFFLAHVNHLLIEKMFTIVNIDSTIIAQVPKLAPHIDSMRNNLAKILHLDISQINIKATTMEKLDAIGRAEAIAVHAVALIEYNTIR